MPPTGPIGDLAIVAGESDVGAAKAADAVFLANGPEFERSPRDFVAAVQRMREELGPWLSAYAPAVSIGATHSIVGVGPKVGDWPLIPGHMGLHNWEFVTHAR